ncbi:methionyl-tRNA synthetase, mitochondrial isoform X2 [Megachile rotundata]|uniref:methionyl-tRNA synthetase, mitochondrial isoform X2 n=1 Tax=Megachile rotundata TaxID=143995 RepID=UPI003FD639C1
MAYCSHKAVRLFSSVFMRNGVIGIESLNKKFIMTSCSRVEKVLEKLQKNPFFDKYAEKIAKYQQTNPDEFLQRVESQEEKLQKKKVTVHALREPIHSSWTFPFPIKRAQSSWTYYARKNHFCHSASEKMYITTPIFYVNGAPHIGHLYTAVLADTVARFNSMLGHSVYLCTGTDEHGTKVQKAADAAAVPTTEYCNQISHQFLEMCNMFEVKYSDFIRTTEERHKNAVHHFWDRLEKNGHIYLGKYAGWYNETEEAFVSDKDVVKQVNASNNTEETRTTSGDLVEWMEEDSYKFRLSSFKDDLQYWLKQENVIYPVIYRNALNYYMDDLQDLSISRPVKRVPWAIPTPHDESHTVYVWFDALVNYLTSVGYPDDSFRKLWPPTIQIIGKDILKFHGIYWPAFLMAAGLEPPKLLLCHGHWTVNKYKMSKSKGNVVSPFTVANDLTREGLRYYILKQGVIDTNSSYNPAKVTEIINTDLANTLGNLVNRCFGKTINPRKVIPDPVECIGILKSDIAIKNIKSLEELSEKTEKYYKAYQVHHAIESAIETLHIANQMFDHHQPWRLSKAKDPDSIKELEAVISLALESARVTVLTLYPVMPKLSSDLLDFLQVPLEDRTWKDTKPLHLTNDTKGGKYVSKEMVFFKKIKN